MSDDNDIFAGPTPPAPPAPQTFEDLVGEGKKYKTTDDVAHAIYEKDRFIEQLKRENAEAREALSKRGNEEEFLQRLEALTHREPPAQPDPPAREGVEQPGPTALTPEQVEEIIARREINTRRKENLDTVMAQLQAKFGDDYRSFVQSQARTLGVGTTFLSDVAAESPEAFFRFVGLDAPTRETVTAPPRSAVTTPPGKVKRDYAYWQKLRREKGDNWYFSVATRQEMYQAAKELEDSGEKFLP